MKKKVKMIATFSSIFRDRRWLCLIRIWNFSSKEVKKNEELLLSIQKAVNKYNK